ncbi:MAG: hypothetical protein KC425_10290 [Anaerolineales bacterium]|nr:hypothetical protein [Anaerolineales bacterium]
MGHLRVCLFGKFGVELDGHAVAGFEAGKVQELLCYLALHRQQPHRREKLAALLWADASAAQSKRYLSKVLWQLQTAVDNLSPSATPCFVSADPDWLQFNCQAPLWLDVNVFEQAFQQVRDVPGVQLPADAVARLQHTVSLYQADLLEGWYQDWCIFERERFQFMLLSMLDKLMQHAEAQGAYETAVSHGIRILRFDRAREHTHRRLIRLHYLSGNRTAALRQYAHCVAALKEELGVSPAAATTELYRQVAADALERPSLSPALNPSAASDHLLNRLKRIPAALSRLQRQIEQEIEAVEAALNDTP